MSAVNVAQASGLRLRGVILRSVSRSFYLSVRILPERLRTPVALGYLLARASDTIADTTGLEPDVRAEKLHRIARAIQDEKARDGIADLAESFASLQENESERRLIKSLPACLDWLNRLDGGDRDEIRFVLDKINRGQLLDLDRFQNPKQIVAVEKSADLDEYTYLVAGCVGEFWTRLCVRHLRKFATKRESEMLELGKGYGMGLQLINILRDAGSDLRGGRCYFPKQELDVARIGVSEILCEPERFQAVYSKWREKAERGIDCGMEYSRAIHDWRVRAATVLPALIGARTLALLRDAGTTVLHRQIKMPRREVRTMITTLLMTLGSRSQIDAMFKKARL